MPVAMATAIMDGDTMVSDSNGLLVFTGKNYGPHSLSVSARHFNDLNTELSIEGDTLITIQLVPIDYNITFSVQDHRDSSPLYRAEIHIENKKILTNYTGHAVYALPRGAHQITVAKEKYAENTLEINITGDSLIRIRLKRELADATFQVYEKGSAVPGAGIFLDGDTLKTSQSGMAIATNLRVDTLYGFEIWKDSIMRYAGSFSLRTDSTIEISLGPVAINDKNREGGYRIYPVPATNRITIEGFREKELIYIYNLAGILVGQYEIKPPRTVIDVSELPGGLYHIKTDPGTKFHTIIKL